VAEAFAKLEIERSDLARERAAVDADRETASEGLARARAAKEATELDRAVKEGELTAARAEHEERTRTLRRREQELAGLEARLASLEEQEASRAGFSDAARMVLVQANGHVGQQGALADYLDVDGRYEKAVEACLGDLLQHVIVERHEQAAAGLALVREQDAGRCGFLVLDAGAEGVQARETLQIPGVAAVSDVVRMSGPHVGTLQQVLPEGYLAETFDQALAVSRLTTAPVATLDGDVFRGPHLVAGGAKAAARGILQTKREIKELRVRIEAERDALHDLGDEVLALERRMREAVDAIGALQAEHHRQEKAIVGHEAQIARATDDEARLTRKSEVIAFEVRRAEEEQASLDSRLGEAYTTMERRRADQLAAEEQLAAAQQRLAEVRATVDELSRKAAEARASHAALVERASALASEVLRLEESARDLEDRITSRGGELEQVHARRETLLGAIAENERTLDDDVRALDALREDVRTADDAAAALRGEGEAQDLVIREARRALEGIRGQAGELEVARATAESDLAHLSQTCVDAVQCTLDEVMAEVEQLEQAGQAVPDAAAISAEEPDPEAEEGEDGLDAAAEPLSVTGAAVMTAEEAIATLRGKIDRLGPVNMMAIEQFDELESRHTFLTTQRRDLIESIAQTSEAIRRIDDTTKARFKEAFTAIQQNFQVMFSTLFGGGRAGLSLLDENDPLESGIDIVASPPGKRLQSVQLLSGGEKALTAIALMFAIFKYKPSPFCLLDEIDAPLDDANVGRFVEMLRSMLDRTQFIVITHNRRTMEVANRLYGVTMEEPGVSKLISVQLN
jgi:chromosome segregation protein